MGIGKQKNGGSFLRSESIGKTSLNLKVLVLKEERFRNCCRRILLSQNIQRLFLSDMNGMFPCRLPTRINTIGTPHCSQFKRHSTPSVD